MLTERWYQSEARELTISYIAENIGTAGRNPLIAMPTGTGKSIVIAGLIKSCAELYGNDFKAFMITHNSTLVRQNMEKLKAVIPEADAGVYCAELGEKCAPSTQIIFGTIQSIANALKADHACFGKRQVMIIDEAHRVPPELPGEKQTQYRTAIAAMMKLSPKMKVIGLTATPYRMDGGLLTDQDPPIFTELVCDYTTPEMIRQFIDEGFLAPLAVPKSALSEQIDTRGIRKVAGDFKRNELESAVAAGNKIEKCCEEIARISRDEGRGHCLIFIPGIDNTERAASAINSLGIECAAVHSKQDSAYNKDCLNAFRNGELPAIASADMLTTGFDAPCVDLIGMLRPTQSVSLWIQMLGRGTRPFAGKENCLVLDYAGNTARLGRFDCPNPVEPVQESARAGAPCDEWKCPNCGTAVSKGFDRCPACGTQRPAAEAVDPSQALDLKASTLPLMLWTDDFAGFALPPLNDRERRFYSRVKAAGHQIVRVSALKCGRPCTSSKSGNKYMRLVFSGVDCQTGQKVSGASLCITFTERSARINQMTLARLRWGSNVCTRWREVPTDFERIHAAFENRLYTLPDLMAVKRNEAYLNVSSMLFDEQAEIFG